MARSRPTASAYLAARTRFGIKFGLETMRELLSALGDPHLAYPTLLIAGTNGKGSVAAYADAALRAGGLRCGRYTSPHLVRLEERITVAGREITPAGLETAVAKVRRAAERLLRAKAIAGQPTFFEAITAAAFVHFRDRAVEAAVVEVGMGGRLDATNVAEPLASAIVTVDLDHEAYLGRTLGAIAVEKAGVLRRGRAAVLGRMSTAAEIAVRRAAEVVGAPCVNAFEGVTVAGEPPALRVTTARGAYEVATLPGAHQKDNAVVALRLLEEASAAGLRFDLARAAAGFAQARWPGRLQRVAGRPPVLLDGAHNPAGALALAAALRAEPPFVLVFGAMADKDVAAVGRTLFPLARAVVVTRAPGERAAAPDEIVERVGPPGPPVQVEPNVGRALQAARRIAGPGGLVVVAGSLYLVGDVLRRLRAVRTSPAAAKAAAPRSARGGPRAASPRGRRRTSPPAPTGRGGRTRAPAPRRNPRGSRARRGRGAR